MTKPWRPVLIHGGGSGPETPGERSARRGESLAASGLRTRSGPRAPADGPPIIVVACETPVYDLDGVTLIGTCGYQLGPWRGSGPEAKRAARDLAASLGWQLAPTVRCPGCARTGVTRLDVR